MSEYPLSPAVPAGSIFVDCSAAIFAACFCRLFCFFLLTPGTAVSELSATSLLEVSCLAPALTASVGRTGVEDLFVFVEFMEGCGESAFVFPGLICFWSAASGGGFDDLDLGAFFEPEG